jgi:hypothetical protein
MTTFFSTRQHARQYRQEHFIAQDIHDDARISVSDLTLETQDIQAQVYVSFPSCSIRLPEGSETNSIDFWNLEEWDSYLGGNSFKWVSYI